MLQETTASETESPANGETERRDWHWVDKRLRQVARRRCKLETEEAALLREAEKMKLWIHVGCATYFEYLEKVLGYTPRAARERVRVANALLDLPQLAALYDDGRFHYSAIQRLTRVANRATEEKWIRETLGKTVRDVEERLAGHKYGDAPEHPVEQDLTPRSVRFRITPGTLAMWRQARLELEAELGQSMDDDLLLQTLCRRAREAAEHPSAKPAYQIAITTCRDCKRATQNGAGREHDISPATLDRANCDAEHLGSLEAQVPARITQTVTQRKRRQVSARDHYRCTAPGCRSARNLDIHHIRHQSQGGGHELRNLTTVCSGHHQRLHEGQIVVSGFAPDMLDWRNRDGSLFGRKRDTG